jgi:hypothetical protein
MTISCVESWTCVSELCAIVNGSSGAPEAMGGGRRTFLPQMHVYPAFDTVDPTAYVANIVSGARGAHTACSQLLRTPSPIYLGEWGRPGYTNATPCLGQGQGLCSEENQGKLYATFAAAVAPLLACAEPASAVVAALSPWTLNTFTGMSAAEDNFGIPRSNGTINPSAVRLFKWYRS